MRKRGGEIRKLSDLFEKYRRTLQAPEASVIHVFLEVIDDVLNITIKKKTVKYTPSTKTIVLTCGAPIKNEIKIHQEEILNHLKGRLGEKSAPKVIL